MQGQMRSQHCYLLCRTCHHTQSRQHKAKSALRQSCSDTRTSGRRVRSLSRAPLKASPHAQGASCAPAHTGHIHNPLDFQARSKLLRNRSDNRLLNKSLMCHRDFRKKTVIFAELDLPTTAAHSLKSQRHQSTPKSRIMSSLVLSFLNSYG